MSPEPTTHRCNADNSAVSKQRRRAALTLCDVLSQSGGNAQVISEVLASLDLHDL
jgi:hypothetical protein